MTSDLSSAWADSNGMIRRIGALLVQEEPDGGAVVVDDRTLTAAHVNKAACVVLQALQSPRTHDELARILAQAAGCSAGDAAGPVSRLLRELKALGWIESARLPS